MCGNMVGGGGLVGGGDLVEYGNLVGGGDLVEYGNLVGCGNLVGGGDWCLGVMGMVWLGLAVWMLVVGVLPLLGS